MKPIIVAALAAAFCTNAFAQAFPSKPIKVIVPYSAGGVVADGTTPSRSIGAGQPMFAVTQITVNAGGGTAASIQIKLVADTATAFSNSYVIADSGAIAYASIAITAAGTNYSQGTGRAKNADITITRAGAAKLYELLQPQFDAQAALDKAELWHCLWNALNKFAFKSGDPITDEAQATLYKRCIEILKKTK